MVVSPIGCPTLDSGKPIKNVSPGHLQASAFQQTLRTNNAAFMFVCARQEMAKMTQDSRRGG